jgi:hypothetical protein
MAVTGNNWQRTGKKWQNLTQMAKTGKNGRILVKIAKSD